MTDVSLIPHYVKQDLILMEGFVDCINEGHLLGDECWCDYKKTKCIVDTNEITLIYHYDTSRS